ncbi:uncharacterized protein [Miscanthus floridulus]|uniref:uncharacterized protein n=1 Tax=Miscanthus floridulus TaxID=154761 RepID=UPI0034595B00
MEPLVEENKKLKEAMNRSEKNIQRAHRERDLVESNARDLEYQKVVLSEHLATVKEQLRSKSEQLATASTQLKDASEQLEKLQKVFEEKKVLDCVEPETAPQPDGRPPRPDIIVKRCKTAWESFKSFNRDVVVTDATHALAVVQSHYPATDLEVIGGGYAKGLSEAKTQRLEDEVEDTAKKLAGDTDLFGETNGSGEA